MWNYLARRLLLGMFTLWAVTFLVYRLMRSMPGDPLLARMERMSPGKKIRDEDRQKMMKIYGLDKPLADAYFIWLGNVLKLNFGNSFSRYQPVTQVISERIGPTLLLSGTSLLLGYLLAVPMGLYATASGGKLDERSVQRHPVHALLVAGVCGGIVLANDFRGQVAGHLAGIAARRHDQPRLSRLFPRSAKRGIYSATPCCRPSA